MKSNSPMLTACSVDVVAANVQSDKGRLGEAINVELFGNAAD